MNLDNLLGLHEEIFSSRNLGELKETKEETKSKSTSNLEEPSKIEEPDLPSLNLKETSHKVWTGWNEAPAINYPEIIGGSAGGEEEPEVLDNLSANLSRERRRFSQVMEEI